MKSILIKILFLSLILVSCKKNEESTCTVTTKPVAEITSNSAKSGGIVSATGNISVELCGICWGENPNPTTSDFFTTDIYGAGEYISVMNNLKPNTRYYVRAYARTGSSVTWGEEKVFTTHSDGGGNNTTFSVSTHGVTEITATTAQCGGVVTCNDGVSITARGVCWSTSHNPTISHQHTNDGQGTGSFTSTLTDLSANTTYYVKAYAKSNSDIVYGTEMVFTTTNEQPNQQPTVTVSLVSATPTYLELKFEPSQNTAYYCFNVGNNITSTTHYTGVMTKKFEHDHSVYFQPNTEHVFTVVAYDSNGTEGETIHKMFKTTPAPYENYLRVYNHIYPLYTATLRNEPTANSDFRWKEIVINGDNGNWLLFQTTVYWYETDNYWSPGIYTINGNGLYLYNCTYAKDGSIDEVDEGSTFTITKSGNITTYDLYGIQGASQGCVTAHFSGVYTN